MFSVILLSMLMILLSILSVIRHLICGNNLKWLVNVNLIYETLDWGRKWLVNFNAGKTQLVCDMPFLEKKISFIMLGGPSIVNWTGVLISSLLLKLAPRKLEL